MPLPCLSLSTPSLQYPPAFPLCCGIPPLSWLISACVLSFGFGQLWKLSQRRGLSAPIVVSSNYLTITITLLIYFSWADSLYFSPAVLLVGSLTGLSFIISMLVMTSALEKAPVGVVLTSFRLAILIPIVFGIFFWGEAANSLQYLGIALALLSLVLMTWQPSEAHAKSVVHPLLLMLAIFILQGISHCCLRSVHYAGLNDQRMHVLCITALSAGLIGTLFSLIRGIRPTARDLGMGIGIGLFNLVALGATLTALSLFPGTLFFPLNGSAVVILDNLCARFIWREVQNRAALIGVALGVVSMLLLFQ